MQSIRFGQGIDEREVLIGLEWDQLEPGISERRAIAKLLKSDRYRGVRYAVVVRGTDDSSIGFAGPGDTVRPRGQSAAALLAKAAQHRMLSGSEGEVVRTTQEESAGNWIVIEKIGDDSYWMVAINKGVPQPTTDIIGNIEFIVEQARGFQASAEFIAHVPDPEMRSHIQFGGIADEHGFSELMRGVELKKSEGLMRQIAGLRVTTFVVVIIIIIVLLVLFGFMQWQHARQARIARNLAAARSAADARAAAMSAKDYRAAVIQAVYTALDAGKKQIDTAMAAPSPSLVIHRWLTLLGSIKLDNVGWKLVDAQCQAGSSPTCTVQLDRGNLGVDRLLLQDIPSALISGNKASYQLPLPASSSTAVIDQPSTQLVSRATNWSLLEDPPSLLTGLVSDLQLLTRPGIQYNLDDSKEIVSTIHMPQSELSKVKPGATAAAPSQSILMGVATGKLGVGGAGLWRLAGIAEFLDRPGIVVDDIKVSLGSTGDVGWQIDADYFVRSRAQPEIPPIKIDDKLLSIPLPPGFGATHSGNYASGISAEQGAPVKQPTPATASAQQTGMQGPAIQGPPVPAYHKPAPVTTTAKPGVP